MCRLFVFVRAQRENFPFIRRVTRFSLSPEPFQMDIQEIFPNPTVPYFQFFKSNRTIFFASGPNMVRRRTIYGTKKNTGLFIVWNELSRETCREGQTRTKQHSQD